MTHRALRRPVLGVHTRRHPAIVAADSTGAVTVAGTASGDYLTIRYAPDGSERWRHRFGGRPDPGQQDQVAGLAADGGDDALVTGVVERVSVTAKTRRR